MRALIEAIRRAAPPPRWRRPSSIALAADAARRALDATGDPERIDLLVNVGVYRDENICEPALAPMIQSRLGALGRSKEVLSFDLSNGACGLLDAFRVVDSLMQAGTVRRALVVASDVDPNPGRSTGLAVRAAGVGVVLRATEGAAGFQDFHAETFPKHAHLYESRLEWLGPASRRFRRSPGHAITLRAMDAYAERCAESVSLAAARFLDTCGLAPEDLDLVVVPELPAGLPARLAALLGVAEERLASDPASAGTCSAAPGLALESALASGRLDGARRALLVAAGAGITVSLALYGRAGAGSS
jgi:3-oxoacyl-[acyl-carrier-protein] synthase-3